MNPEAQPKTLVIAGSARGESNTEKMIAQISPFSNYELVNLRDFHIEHYSYDETFNPEDDFFRLVDKMQVAENLVFATPVYWYAMSGRMKIFFDRLTDLISKRRGLQHLGRSLAGKNVYLIACGSDPELPEGFEVPFRRTAEYFDMTFQGSRYLQIQSN